MTRSDNSGRAINLTAGWLCLAVGALNWWNMTGVGATFWRVILASAITLIGIYLLATNYGRGKPTDP